MTATGRARLFLLVIMVAMAALGAAAHADEAPYRIKAGDVLGVVVYGEPTLSFDVPVLPDGTISYPFVGTIHVVGLSAEELAREISDSLSDVVRVPVVSVVIKPGQGPYVLVLGEVRQPGVYPIASSTISLLEAIGIAGGTLPGADLAQVKVYERGNVRDYQEAPIGAEGMLFSGEASINPEVASGNIVYVPPLDADNQVIVLGEVRSPGAYPVAPGREARLIEIIAQAGGTTPEADLAAVKIYDRADVRDFREAPIGAAGMLFEGTVTENPVVKVGNIIYVPPTDVDNQVFVLGEVRTPGAYLVAPGREARLLEIIAQAGGTTPEADLAAVKIYDRGDIRDYREAPIGAAGMLFEGTATENPVVKVGNIIYVPPLDADNQVIVLGEVRSPGAYPVAPGREARLLEIIAQAGGTTPDADLAAVKIYDRGDISDYREAPIGAAGMLFEGTATENPVVKVGNIIYVPPTEVDNQVFVLGEVRSPGAYVVTPGREARLLEIIAQAGGTTPDADLAAVKIYDRGDIKSYREAPIGAAGVLFDGQLAENPVIEIGNIIYVPPSDADNQVFVLGEVRQPGAYPVEPGRQARLLDIIAQAGGTTGSADLAAVKIYDRGDIKSYREAPIGAAGVLFEGEAAANPEVFVGNIIYVPPSDADNQVFVLGEVRQPGAYPIEPGRQARLLDIIAQAGGTTASADLAAVKIYDRGDIASYKEAPIGAQGILFDGVAATNPVVQVGNIIYVPPSDADNQVFILGEVRSPGAYAVEPGRQARLLDIIAQAGGTTPDADLAAVKIYDRGNIRDYREAPIGARGVLFEGLAADNPVVHVGNIIYVPGGTIQVSVIGRVAKPGSYQVKAGSRLLDLLSLAGGLLPEADSSHMTLRRELPGGEVERLIVNLEDVVKGATPESNLALQSGDVLFVEPTLQVAVAGEVRNNGVFRLSGRSRITDAILAAGGTTANADLSNLTISRQSGDSQQLITVDFAAVLAGKAPNVTVEDGDIINVPHGVKVVYVAGEVARPGAVRVTEASRLIDVIYEAGGPTADADTRQITIFAKPEFGGVQAFLEGEGAPALPLGRVIYQGAVEQNPYVQPGQTVYIPQKSMEIFVLGSVPSTGLTRVPRDSKILDVVAAIGGPNDQGDWRSVQVLRAGGEEAEVVDVMALLADPRSQTNVPIFPGDVVYVPANKTQVSVLGAVSRPGTYALPRDSGLVEALAAAGGASQRAALESVSIIQRDQDGKAVEVRLGQDSHLSVESLQQDFRIEDGSVVVVPESRRITWEQVIAILSGVKLIKDLVDDFSN